MPINFYRVLPDHKQDRDTSTLGQCLLCYEEFAGIRREWKYCPYCGTKWVGQWPSADELQAQNELEYRIQQRRYEVERTRKPRSWWVVKLQEIKVMGYSPGDTYDAQYHDVKCGHWNILNRIPVTTEDGKSNVNSVLQYVRRRQAEYNSDAEAWNTVGFSIVHYHVRAIIEQG